MINAMGDADSCRPWVGEASPSQLPTGGAMHCESTVLKGEVPPVYVKLILKDKSGPII